MSTCVQKFTVVISFIRKRKKKHDSEKEKEKVQKKTIFENDRFLRRYWLAVWNVLFNLSPFVPRLDLVLHFLSVNNYLQMLTSELDFAFSWAKN